MDHSLLDQLADIARLPVAPATVRSVGLISNTETVGEFEIGGVLERDPGMCLWMIKQANSGLFGGAGGVGTIEEAVVRVGARATKIVSLSMVPSGGGFVAGGVRGAVAEVWSRSRVRDMLIEQIVTAMGETRVLSTARSAGYGLDAVWHTVAIANPELAVRMMEHERDGGTCDDLIGVPACVMSAKILERWGFPEEICGCVRACADLEGVDQRAEVVLRVVCGAEVVLRHAMQRGVWRDAARAGEMLRTLTGIEPDEMARMVRGVGAAYEDDLRAWIESEEHGVREMAVETLSRLSIALHVEHHRLIHQRDELLHRVTLDRLTGVFNRGAFDDRISEEMERARRGGEPLSLLMCDLDEFKLINDRYGHQAGDFVLKRVAEVVVDAARRIDVVARYGGEEFAVIAPRCDYPGAAYLAERLRGAVAGLEIEWQGDSLGVTMSVGGAVCTWPGATLLPEQLIAAADRRLYDAKRNGRNCVRIEGPDRVRAWAG